MTIIDEFKKPGYTIKIIEEKDFLGNIIKKEKALLTEHLLYGYIQNTLAIKMVCTPKDLSYLLLGHLYSENIITTLDEIKEVKIGHNGEEGWVTLKEKGFKVKEVVEINSCNSGKGGLIGRNQSVPLAKNTRFPAIYKSEDVFLLAKTFKQGAPLYQKTHAIHSCMLLHNGEVKFIFEDIGRHNALDKVLGKALLEKIPLEEAVVFTSGRMPVDMVKKAIRAKVGVLASNTMATEEAILLAKEQGLTLIGKVREHSFEIY